MSDTIKKWHEMQEDKLIFESPDGGKTVTKRPFGSEINEREVILQPVVEAKLKKDAYTILSMYSEESIKYAAKILEVEMK